MTGDNGLHFLLDLEKTTELRDGNDLLLDDGRHVRVLAAKELLMKVTAKDSHHLLTMFGTLGTDICHAKLVLIILPQT